MKNTPLTRVNGFVVSGAGVGGEIEGPIEILFAGLLGALAGFVLGLLAVRLGIMIGRRA